MGEGKAQPEDDIARKSQLVSDGVDCFEGALTPY